MIVVAGEALIDLVVTLDGQVAARPGGSPYNAARSLARLGDSLFGNGGNSGGTFVITHVDIGGQGTNAADLLRKLAEPSRKEEGNLRFDVLQHAMRANHFTIIEEWQTAKAVDKHASATHTKEYRNLLAPIAGGPLDERLYKPVE